MTTGLMEVPVAVKGLVSIFRLRSSYIFCWASIGTYLEGTEFTVTLLRS